MTSWVAEEDQAIFLYFFPSSNPGASFGIMKVAILPGLPSSIIFAVAIIIEVFLRPIFVINCFVLFITQVSYFNSAVVKRAPASGSVSPNAPIFHTLLWV